MRLRLRRARLLLAVLTLLCWIPRLTLVGLSDPSEARYAAIAREMAEGGDWLVPRWQGVPHLEKPPLAYWAAAAGIRLLGPTELAVRLGPALALLGSALLTAGLAARFAGPGAALLAAAAVLFSPYALAAGLACLTDGYVLLGTVAFYWCVERHLRDGRRRWLDLAAAAVGFGFLAKGHAILLYTLLPLAVACTGALGPLFRPRRLLILAALMLPWPLAMELRDPGFLAAHGRKLFYFLATGRQHHHAPFYIYLVTLLGAVFPFSLGVLGCRESLKRPLQRLVYAWLLLPVAVLTVIPSRSWTYILPCLPAFAILCACGLRVSDPPPVLRQAGGVLVALCIPLVLLLPGVPDEARKPLAACFAAGGAWIVAAARTHRLVRYAGLAAIASLGMTLVSLADPGDFKIHRRLAHRAEALARPGETIYVAATNAPSFGFYIRKHPVVLVRGPARLREEASMWGAGDRYLPGKEALARVLRGELGGVVIAHEELWARYAPERPVLDRVRKMLLLRRVPPPAAQK